VKSLWPYPLGGKKVHLSLGKRSILYGGSMSWTLFEHNYKWFCISCVGCDFFRGKASGQGKLFIYHLQIWIFVLSSVLFDLSRFMYQH
jgi:hypothetical protein